MLASMERQSAPLANEGAWLLVAELNHRVGNELQAAISAVRLAKRGLATSDPARFLDEAALRLEAFGDVHQLLDRQRFYGPLPQRLEALCRATASARAAPLGVHLALQLEDVSTDEETAWTVCVVAAEYMTNAFKHAFSGDAPRIVKVSLGQDADGVLLTVADNGVGPCVGGRSAQTVWQSPGFGTGIVAELAKRLGGAVSRVCGPCGATASFRIPAARNLS